MAQLPEGYELLLKGCSGKFRDMVLFNRNGKTFTRKAPGSYNKIPTTKQEDCRNRLNKANQLAKAAMLDPVLKAYFQAKAVPPQNAYNAAVKEYMKTV